MDNLKFKYNANPITKLVAIFVLSLHVYLHLHRFSYLATLCIVSIYFYMNNKKRDTFYTLFWGLILLVITNYYQMPSSNKLFQSYMAVFIFFYFFYPPYIGFKILAKTSDVGSIISAMDKLKLSKKISIPIAVMFRFFPSFIEEKNNIKMAMRVRNVSIKNPIKYIEYVSIPLLMISSNIADDISKSAESKCIESRARRTNFYEIKFKTIDFIYLASIILVTLGGIYA